MYQIDQIDIQDVDTCLRYMSSCRRVHREAGLAAARQLPTGELAELVMAAALRIRKISRRDWVFYLPFWVIAGMPLLAYLLTCIHGYFSFDLNGAVGADIAFVICLPCAVLLYDSVINPTHRYLTLDQLILERADVTLLKPTLELHFWSQLAVTARRNTQPNSLMPAIEQMVYRMNAGDYADLLPTHKQMLLRWLRRPQANYPLAFALLHALKNVGDGSALEEVAAIAGQDAKTWRQKRIRAANHFFILDDVGITVAPFRRGAKNRNAGPLKEEVAEIERAKMQTELEAAALECFACMQRNRDEEQAPKTLLRPSNVTAGCCQEVLLRPAADSSAITTNPDELLRAPLSQPNREYR